MQSETQPVMRRHGFRVQADDFNVLMYGLLRFSRLRQKAGKIHKGILIVRIDLDGFPVCRHRLGQIPRGCECPAERE